MKKIFLIFLLAFTLIMTSCSTKIDTTDKPMESEIRISRHPKEADFNREKPNELPSFSWEADALWQVDVRNTDLSDLNLDDRIDDLLYADFDSNTKWPENLPKNFDLDKIIEFGKNPGLMIDQLHEKGITGKGIGIAMIDQTLLVDHVEYKDNLKLYEEIYWASEQAEMHGSAVASIAVGKSVGVAPEADLYYISAPNRDRKNNGAELDFTWLAQSINRVLEINQQLPEENKIRVLSISVAWNQGQKGYEEVNSAVKEAMKQGIFVVSSALPQTHNYFIADLGRSPMKDSNDFASYEPSIWYADGFYDGSYRLADNILLIPAESRVTASPTGIDDYVFYRQGGSKLVCSLYSRLICLSLSS